MGRRIAVVLGTRPEWIKLEPVILALVGDGAEVVVLDTGQHSHPRPTWLESQGPITVRAISRGSDEIVDFFADISVWLGKELKSCSPDLVIVQGDTLSTLAGAQTAFLRKIPIAHVEAGLRSRNLERPFPEEGIRRMVSQIASFHFCATNQAKDNVVASGLDGERAFVVGNTVIDQLAAKLRSNHEGPGGSGVNRILVTCHRRESWASGLAQVLDAVQELAVARLGDEFFVVRHPNPEWSSLARSARPWTSNVRVLDPLDHEGFLDLLTTCRGVITDSGGIQEEAAFLGIPTILVRSETDRPESIKIGSTRLAAFDKQKIVAYATEALEGIWTANPSMVFGAGDAGRQISKILRTRLFDYRLEKGR